MINLPVLLDIGVSTTLSAIVHIDPNYPLLGLEIPVLDSSTIYIQGAVDGSTFRRLMKADGSGDFSITAGAGNRLIFLDQAALCGHIRVECGSAQSANRTFYLTLKK